MIRSVVQGCGAYLPDRVVTNDELAKKVDTSDEWIQQRTGIRQRHIAADGEFTSHLAIKAAERALAHAGMKAADLDLIILATATPDETFPATATRVQAALGMTRGAAFDVQAVCAGFVYAVSVADSMIKSGAASTALVIGAETFSRILDWNDRGTCVLFGDGAGAIVMRGEEGKGTSADRGVLANALHSDGRQHDILYVDGGPSSTKTTGFLRMEGKEVFKQAVVNMAAVVGEVLGKVGPGGQGHRLAGPAPGQQAHHRRHRPQARPAAGARGDHGRSPRQHLRRLDPAGARHRGQGRPHQEGRPAAAGRHRRRPRLGRLAHPLVVTDD